MVIYVRCFMYLGLLVYFIHVIIAKFGQFNLYEAHYLTSSCFSNPVAYHLFIPLLCRIQCSMQICWSCKLRACDAKSLRILVPSREEVILDLQRSRQKDPIANQQLLSYFFFFDCEIVLPRAYIAQFWSFYCTAISEPFALVCRFGTPWTASS